MTIKTLWAVVLARSMRLVHLSQAETLVKMFAPNIDQMHVLDDLKGCPTEEERNVLVERPRLTGDDFTDLKDLNVAECDAVVFPGGCGVAKNSFSWALNGNKCIVNDQVKDTLEAFHKAKKPMELCCISPVLAAKVIPGCEVPIEKDVNTCGRFPSTETPFAIEEHGRKHVTKDIHESHVD